MQEVDAALRAVAIPNDRSRSLKPQDGRGSDRRRKLRYLMTREFGLSAPSAYLLTRRHRDLCKGLVLIAINCDKAIESNANLRVERLLLFNEAVGACLDSRNSELTLMTVRGH